MNYRAKSSCNNQEFDSLEIISPRWQNEEVNFLSFVSRLGSVKLMIIISRRQMAMVVSILPRWLVINKSMSKKCESLKIGCRWHFNCVCLNANMRIDLTFLMQINATLFCCFLNTTEASSFTVDFYFIFLDNFLISLTLEQNLITLPLIMIILLTQFWVNPEQRYWQMK